MIEEQLQEQFARRIHAETQEKLAEMDSIPLAAEVALLEVMLGYLEEAGTFAEHEICPYEDLTGRNRCRVIAYALPEDARRLELFTSLYVPEHMSQALPTEEIERLTGRAAKFFEYASKGVYERFAGNEAAAAAARHINEEFEQIEEVRIHVLTNGMVKGRIVDPIEIAGRQIDFSVFDLERLFRSSQEDVSRDRIEIDCTKLLGRPLACLEMRPRPTEYETYLLMVPGNLIADLYDEYGARLFEFNVRSFLQAKGNVNKGLRETLRISPERFLAYNNGITATADEIEVATLAGETVIKRIKGLQIVNGAQTTASIHRARKIDRIAVDQVAVCMKLTLVQPEKLGEFVPLIARYANTQNVVQISDLSANNPFHIAMERLSGKVWCPGEESRWFYERTRGAYQVACLRYGSTPAKRREFEQECPKQHNFSKTDLARCLMAWWQFPQTVCKGMQKNFAIFMTDLSERFPSGEPGEAFYREAVSLIILFKRTQSIVRKLKLPSYGTQVAAYVVSKLSVHCNNKINLGTIWESQEISEELEAIIVEWAPRIHEAIIAGAGRSNVGEWCKKNDCWTRIKDLVLTIPSELPEFDDQIDADEAPNVVGVNSGIEPTDAVDICCKLNGVEWTKVMAWAAGSGKVLEFDLRVANTIAGYAMTGWRSRPTVKQAKRGVRVLQAAVGDGIIGLE
ncbi:AIPR family protein [Collimonas sp.]|uniref:AIPR family protein n=1 Tax=Collimonas sp. TaxID=1963772 RepID=UPI002CFD1182|nr:AIPR family protein [Collimonas sp.]HWW05884.1 AIPR family protein [Collimonas sp.]